MKTLAVLFTFLAAGLIFFVSQSLATDQIKQNKMPENLYGIEIKKDKLHVKMLSTGCSKNEDFELIWTDKHQLTIYRSTPDKCRRVPMKKWFIFNVPKQHNNLTISNHFSDK